MTLLAALEAELALAALVHFFLGGRWFPVSRVQLHGLRPMVFLLGLFLALSTRVVSLSFQVSLEETVVNPNHQGYHCLQVLRTFSPNNVVLNLVLKAPVELGCEGFVVLVCAPSVLLEFYSVGRG